MPLSDEHFVIPSLKGEPPSLETLRRLIQEELGKQLDARCSQPTSKHLKADQGLQEPLVKKVPQGGWVFQENPAGQDSLVWKGRRDRQARKVREETKEKKEKLALVSEEK
ncbi:UNVERIFIED_CONTAM: hypothetical protein K2H54_013713 [Gekko kuhli]